MTENMTRGRYRDKDKDVRVYCPSDSKAQTVWAKKNRKRDKGSKSG